MDNQNNQHQSAKSAVELTDQSLMPFGKHKGKALANVPAGYLLWIYDNLTLRDDLRLYIKRNQEVLVREEELRKA